MMGTMVLKISTILINNRITLWGLGKKILIQLWWMVVGLARGMFDGSLQSLLLAGMPWLCHHLDVRFSCVRADGGDIA